MYSFPCQTESLLPISWLRLFPPLQNKTLEALPFLTIPNTEDSFLQCKIWFNISHPAMKNGVFFELVGESLAWQ